MRTRALLVGLFAFAGSVPLACGLSVEGTGSPEVGGAIGASGDASTTIDGAHLDAPSTPLDVWRPPAADAAADGDAGGPPPCQGHYCEGDPTCRSGDKCGDCPTVGGPDFFCADDRVCRKTCNACNDKIATILCDGPPYGRCRNGDPLYQHCGCANGNPATCPYANQVCAQVPFTTSFVCSTCGELGSGGLSCKRGGTCVSLAQTCF